MADRINYPNKVQGVDRPEIPENEKFTYLNANEVKNVSDSHATDIEIIQGAMELDSYDTVADATADWSVSKVDGREIFIRDLNDWYYWDSATTPDRCLFSRYAYIVIDKVENDNSNLVKSTGIYQFSGGLLENKLKNISSFWTDFNGENNVYITLDTDIVLNSDGDYLEFKTIPRALGSPSEEIFGEGSGGSSLIGFASTSGGRLRAYDKDNVALTTDGFLDDGIALDEEITVKLLWDSGVIKVYRDGVYQKDITSGEIIINAIAQRTDTLNYNGSIRDVSYKSGVNEVLSTTPYFMGLSDGVINSEITIYPSDDGYLTPEQLSLLNTMLSDISTNESDILSLLDRVVDLESFETKVLESSNPQWTTFDGVDGKIDLPSDIVLNADGHYLEFTFNASEIDTNSGKMIGNSTSSSTLIGLTDIGNNRFRVKDETNTYIIQDGFNDVEIPLNTDIKAKIAYEDGSLNVYRDDVFQGGYAQSELIFNIFAYFTSSYYFEGKIRDVSYSSVGGEFLNKTPYLMGTVSGGVDYEFSEAAFLTVEQEDLLKELENVNNIDKDEVSTSVLDTVKEVDNSEFYKSIASVKSSGSSHTTTVHIPNHLGVEQNNIVAQIIVNKQANSGDSTNEIAFMDGNCKDDMSDVRVLNGADILPSITSKSNNIHIEEFDIGFILGAVSIIQEYGGEYYTNDDDNSYTVKSTDLKNWTTVITERFVFIGVNGDIFTSLGDDLKQYRASESYSTGRIVISDLVSNIWRAMTFRYDKFGHLYCGGYQDAYDTSVYKSTNNGDSWSKVFNSTMSDSQHVHNLVIDQTLEPNRIYVSFDGNVESDTTAPSQWYSDDYGSTWTQDDLAPKLHGYPVDNGIFYAEGDYLLGGSEGDAKSAPTLYYSEDKGETFNIVEWGFQAHELFKINGNMLVASFPRTRKSLSKLLISKNGKDFTEILSRHVGSVSTTGAGYRFGTTTAISFGGKETLVVMPNTETDILPTLKITSEPTDFSTSIMVQIDTLPIGGITLDVESNYMTANYNENIFNKDVIDSLVYSNDFNQIYRKKEQVTEYPLHSQLIDNFVSQKDKRMTRLIDINVEKTITAMSEFSVSFWLGADERILTTTTSDSVPLFDIFGNSFYTQKGTRMNVKNNIDTSVLNLSAVTNCLEYRPQMFTFVFKAGKTSLYLGDIKEAEQDLVLNVSEDLIKFVSDYRQEHLYISEFKVFDKELTYYEVANLYNNKAIN